ncbi:MULTISPECIES: penicillin-binding protein [unclassified Adlercreutzia]|uniref:penicillin-binding protein n=1 Tax=unclassified Adlercreutzia TaxID=2636013 RepID=UPI0013EA8D2A|nr:MULTISPECIES: transglycosylase domain-containing protein [unclassified Adlercreutzia]
MKVRRKQREKRSHAVQWGLLVAVLSVSLIAYSGVHGVLRIMEGWADDLPDVSSFDFASHAEESTMWAADGTTKLAQFQLEKRDPVTLDQVNTYVTQATIATEDSRFYEHDGVDIMGIARAVLNNLRGGDMQGASTITQQLVRNTILFDEMDDISLKRKIREATLALEMEKRFSKDDILLMYLNTINYGDGCYGIQAAAQNYFQVNASDLTLTQAATLAGIPQSPTYLNPKENPDACLERRNIVLDRMLSVGDITQEEHDAAVAEELNLNPAPDARIDGITAFPYFTSYVRDLLLDENNGFDVSYEDLFAGGLTIHTTLDPVMQEKAEQTCAEQCAQMADNLEAALVAIDPATGHILALVGGKDFDANQFNIATQGGRPAGSSFKAFTLATAIEEGIDPDTLIDCTNPLKMETGDELYNYGKQDQGIRSIASATAVSSNTGYYRLIQEVGSSQVVNMAHRLGVTSPLSNLPIITLGTENTTPLEMAEAYSSFATGGTHRKAIAITRIENSDGEVLYEAPDTSERVLDEKVAGAVTKVLRGVFESPEGTAYGFGLASGQPVAGKTGTGTDWRDHTLVGYTPTLCCSVWIGARDYSPTDENLTCNWLWSTFMSRALEGTEITNFPDVEDPKYNNNFNEKQKELTSKAAENAPNTSGKTLDEAKELLNSYKTSYVEEYSDSVPAGTVISQSVQDGKIVVVVSKGPNPDAQGTDDPNAPDDEGNDTESGDPNTSGESAQPAST